MIYWLYRVAQFINGINVRNDEEVVHGLLMLLGFLGLAIILLVIFSHRKAEKILS